MTLAGGTIGYPLIAEGLVFAMSADPAGRGRSVVALSAETGERVWGPLVIGGWTTGPSSFAYDAGQVFILGELGRIVAVDAVTGEVNWDLTLDLPSGVNAPVTARDGVVYVGARGYLGNLLALDEQTGEILWTAYQGTGDTSSPTVSADGVYVSYACKETYKFALDGSLIWRRPGSCTGGGGMTTVLHGDRLYVRSPDTWEWPSILDAATGAELELATFSGWAPPAFDDSHMITVAGGLLTAYDLRSGSDRLIGDPLWQAAEDDYTVPPLVVNGYVVGGRSDGTVDMRDIETGALVWRGSAGGPIPLSIEWGQAVMGMAQGDGVLAVPAGSTLTVFEPAGDTTVRLEGPAAGSSVGPGVRFVFSSGVRHARYVCTVDGVDRECTSPWSPAGLGDGSHTLGVRVAYATVGAVSTRFTLDATSPKVSVAPFSSAVIHTSTTRARWSAIDRGTGVKAYQVRVGRAPVGKPIRSWKVRARSQATSATFSVPRATRLCVSVRAGDLVGNWSGWSSPRCVNRT
ncbi:outer membrane protein assembly factor BamB family protein [Cellulomonas gilvus]|uniref:outer membrane protein assembly factor BamB family protein n=1 Tax=Cellulomonas gilvus TaxID=11 RepID=UPI001FE1E5F3|nr:PQQ-binding-like beta-propeller repeat protein [Cellulomonas gilvus]